MQVLQDVRGYCFPDALGYLFGLLARHVGQNYPELLAAPAPDDIHRLQMSLDCYHGAPQHVITHKVAVCIVVLLEAVDVEHDQANGLLSNVGLCDSQVKFVYKGAVMVSPGKGVALCLLVHCGVQLGILKSERCLACYGSEQAQVVLVKYIGEKSLD